jgi:hypothetical protein
MTASLEEEGAMNIKSYVNTAQKRLFVTNGTAE